MIGIYLCSGKAKHDNYNLVYNDIVEKSDFMCDCFEIDLSKYDFYLASPPCNYYSRNNYRREVSSYSQLTKHILPDLLKLLLSFNKPFIVENVRSSKIFNSMGLFDLPCDIYFIGRHTYWTNVSFYTDDIPQRQDFLIHGKLIRYDDMNTLYRQGGYNVFQVFEKWLSYIHSSKACTQLFQPSLFDLYLNNCV